VLENESAFHFFEKARRSQYYDVTNNDVADDVTQAGVGTWRTSGLWQCRIKIEPSYQIPV